MNRARLAVTVAAPLILAAACGSSGHSSTGTTTAASSHPLAGQTEPLAGTSVLNPVDLMRRFGGVPPPGATVGSLDAKGNHFVEGTIGAGNLEEVSVYVWTTPGSAWPEKPSNDGTWYIRGDGFEVDLTGYLDTKTGGTVFPVTPEQAVAKVGGKIVPQG